MKLIYKNIVMVEESDTTETIGEWLIENTDVKAQNLDVTSWIHLVVPGDLLIFNSPFAMFRFSAKMKNEETL